MSFDKFRDICRPIRAVVGLSLIGYGVYASSPLFFLGAIPIIAAVINFCPVCIISKKCSI